MDKYIKAHIPEYDWKMMKDANLVTKTDLFRLLLMYYEGGFYQDVDRMYNVPFDKLIDKDTKMFMPTLYDVTFVSDMVCTAPG